MAAPGRSGPFWVLQLHRRIGDRVPMARQDVLSGQAGAATLLPVDILEPGRAIGHLPCVYVLEPVGDHTTRLLCREYNTYRPLVRWLLWDPMHFTMERRMMLGIKALAEGRTYPPPALDLAALIGWVAAGIGVLGLLLARRRRWPWLLPPAAVALPVLWTTGDVNAALAGFLAVGITPVGALAFDLIILAAIVGVFGPQLRHSAAPHVSDQAPSAV